MLKRFLVLASALVLFISAFFIHQWWTDAQIEGRFRAEREKFDVQGKDLVIANPPTSEPLTPTASPMPVVSSGGADNSLPAAPTSAPASGAAPAEVPLDSNTLIGPMPPAPASSPDTNAPSSAPVSSPDSTYFYPGLHQLPLALIGATTTVSQQGTESTAAPVTAAATPVAAPAASGSNAAATEPITTDHVAPAGISTPASGTNASPAPEVVGVKGGKSAVSAIVLLYHQFTPPGVRAAPKFLWTMPQDVFASEMKYLHDNHFNVVPLADVIAFAKGQKELPPNAVTITFDDGYKSPLVFAEPILKSYNFPWTFFIYPAFIGNHPSSNYRGAASWPELVELQKEGVDIECHSMTHPNLKSTLQVWPPNSGRPHRLTPEEYDAFLTNEIVTSKQILEKQLGKTITCFAYPFGDYNTAVEAKCISAGYEAIFTVAGNPIHVGSPLKSMGRYTLTTPVEKMFTAYVNQRSLVLASIQPAPGATTTDPRPVISAVLRYSGDILVKSINAEVSGMGEVRTDFDPKSSTLRMYLPRDLVAQTILVDVHAKDAESGHTLAASWRFDYQPTSAGPAHRSIGAAAQTNITPSAHIGAPTVSTATKPGPSAENAVAVPASNPSTSAEDKQSLAAPQPGAAAPAPASDAGSAASAPSVSLTNAAPSTP